MKYREIADGSVVDRPNRFIEMCIRDSVNSYRVLLTRARQGMVLFVPKGVEPEEDPTRDCLFYDNIYDYLLSCGIKELP